jgi:hypothetical protein
VKIILHVCWLTLLNYFNRVPDLKLWEPVQLGTVWVRHGTVKVIIRSVFSTNPRSKNKRLAVDTLSGDLINNDKCISNVFSTFPGVKSSKYFALRNRVPDRKNWTQARYCKIGVPVPVPFLVRVPARSLYYNHFISNKKIVKTDLGSIFKEFTSLFAFVKTRGSVCTYGSEVGYGSVINPNELYTKKYTPSLKYKYANGKYNKKKYV